VSYEINPNFEKQVPNPNIAVTVIPTALISAPFWEQFCFLLRFLFPLKEKTDRKLSLIGTKDFVGPYNITLNYLIVK
jgi:hypothetical protein